MNDAEKYSRLLAIRFRHDLIGLRSHDVPADEWQTELDVVQPRLSKCQNAAEAQQVIYEALFSLFSSEKAGSKERYKAVEEEIWSCWKEA
ncbi:MAG: hypothetical protein KBA75_07950 [Alphaproteobacteria bacterium]|nr:hypothetical protein [Alphaproteobacteria bacterium]